MNQIEQSKYRTFSAQRPSVLRNYLIEIVDAENSRHPGAFIRYLNKLAMPITSNPRNQFINCINQWSHHDLCIFLVREKIVVNTPKKQQIFILGDDHSSVIDDTYSNSVLNKMFHVKQQKETNIMQAKHAFLRSLESNGDIEKSTLSIFNDDKLKSPFLYLSNVPCQSPEFQSNLRQLLDLDVLDISNRKIDPSVSCEPSLLTTDYDKCCPSNTDNAACEPEPLICTSSSSNTDNTACEPEPLICTSSSNTDNTACEPEPLIYTSSSNTDNAACEPEQLICTSSSNTDNAACEPEQLITDENACNHEVKYSNQLIQKNNEFKILEAIHSEKILEANDSEKTQIMDSSSYFYPLHILVESIKEVENNEKNDLLNDKNTWNIPEHTIPLEKNDEFALSSSSQTSKQSSYCALM